MFFVEARNVNDAYTQGLSLLKDFGEEESSRNGRVIVLPRPLVTTYTCPRERVLFSPERNANPFFHFMEALWMLDGRRDAAFVVKFNSQMKSYANSDGTFDGAYGYRWRRHFGYDQLRRLITLLRTHRNTRRAVLAMHDPVADLHSNTLDQPCNTHIYFDVRGGKLNMTVCCRSNDAIWGTYGANAVHMSMLMEVIAGMVEVPMGVYRQFSNNFHYYPDQPGHESLVNDASSVDVRLQRGWPMMMLVTKPATWFAELRAFMDVPGCIVAGYNPIFYHVAKPMYLAWMERKEGISDGLSWVQQIEDPSWRHVCLQWIGRKDQS